ncbi:argininosuccinate lyase [Eisenibacter elegans]|jgi:argininosuccinate lyase|uniref:argininosuccinate lyase n=1 Tax=Eisenibacter elegans TaxID=997 RepID=UPI000418174D|nr:argininosuccinate lyase [Eisenibacter elegans]
MKLWQKDQQADADWVSAFTVGNDPHWDMRLAPFDVLGSLAHIQMLESVGLLSHTEWASLRDGLREVYAAIEANDFEIAAGVEDIHSQVELMLTQRLGEVGKKIHAGRSRNDQVLLDLKLWMRSEIALLTQETQQLFDLLLQLSETHQDKLMPGYTHLQVAMPSSFGLWFGAYAESLVDDLRLLQSAHAIIDQNPLGSAAGYGSSFPLNRRMTTELLGFADLSYNVVYAQMGRGKAERSLAFALASIGATLAKMAMDVCLYMGQNFGFFRFPEHLTTGSSIMPHKKNPDVFELIRAKGNALQALPNTVMMMTTNLPSGYHRDLQLLKEATIPALDSLHECLKATYEMMRHVEVADNLLQDPKYRYLFSVEVVNAQVQAGVPFRDAYRAVGEAIANDTYQPSTTLNHTHEGSIGQLCTDEIRRKMSQVTALFDFEKPQKAFDALLGR